MGTLIMSHGVYLSDICSPCNSLGSQLSLEPLELALSSPSGEKNELPAEKSVIFCQNFQLQSDPIPELASC